MSARVRTLVFLLALLALLLGVNTLADTTLRSARIDLTQGGLYTLSPGTRNILASLDEPVRLTLFSSESAARGRPAIQAYGRRVRELLDEFRLRGRGMLTLEVLDPVAFSEAEERAEREGITGVPLDEATTFFLGLLGTNSTDGREVIPFFDPSQERFLEYEIARLVYRLTDPRRPTIGLMSSLMLDGMPAAPGVPPEMTRPWAILSEIRQQFEIETIPLDSAEIPANIDLLFVLHAKRIPDHALHAVDRFVLSGRPAVIAVDPLCEADIPLEALQNPMAMLTADRSSDLNRLLGAWGVTMETGRVVGDTALAMRGRSGQGREVLPYLQYLAPQSGEMNQSDPVTGGISLLNLAAAGSLLHDPSSGTQWTPLVTSTVQSATLDAARLVVLSDPREVVSQFIASGSTHTLAGRLSGRASTAFPDRGEGAAPETGEINVIVIADADMFSDRWWMNEVRLGGALLGYQKLSDNASLLINALDNLTGSNDLITVRARGEFSRPFTLVERIRREAEQRYLAGVEALEQERNETERRLMALQRARPDSGALVFTPEQQAELDRFRAELASTNAELREMRYNLNRDVERLGLTLKIVNTTAAPALVALAAVTLGAWRGVRRRADRRAIAGEG